MTLALNTSSQHPHTTNTTIIYTRMLYEFQTTTHLTRPTTTDPIPHIPTPPPPHPYPGSIHIYHTHTQTLTTTNTPTTQTHTT